MSQRLNELLTACVNSVPPDKPEATFSLYVRGSRHDNYRQIIGYLKHGETRVYFDEDNLLFFSQTEITKAMAETGCDFSQRPVANGSLNQTWLLRPAVTPTNLGYVRGKSDRGIERYLQDLRFTEFREFENAYPQQAT